MPHAYAVSVQQQQLQQQQRPLSAGSPTADAYSSRATTRWGRPSESNPRDEDEGYYQDDADNSEQQAWQQRSALPVTRNNSKTYYALSVRNPNSAIQANDQLQLSRKPRQTCNKFRRGDGGGALPKWCQAASDSEFELLLLEEEAADALAAFHSFAMQALVSLHMQCARALLFSRCLLAKQKDEWLEQEARWVLLSGLQATKLRLKKRKLFAASVGAVQKGIVVAAQREREQREQDRQVTAVNSGVLASEPRTLALALHVILLAQEARRALRGEEKQAREKLWREWRASQYAARMFELDRENVVVMAAREKRRKRWEQLDPFVVRRRMPLVANAGMVFVPAPPPPAPDDAMGAFGGKNPAHRHVVLARSPNGTLRKDAKKKNNNNDSIPSHRDGTAAAGRNNDKYAGLGTVEANILRQEDARLRQQQQREAEFLGYVGRDSHSNNNNNSTRPGTRNSNSNDTRYASSSSVTAGATAPDNARGYVSRDPWWPNPPPPQQHDNGTRVVAATRGSQLTQNDRRDSEINNNNSKMPYPPPLSSSGAAAGARSGSRNSNHGAGNRHDLPRAAAAHETYEEEDDEL